jgi:hypothetical protein
MPTDVNACAKRQDLEHVLKMNPNYREAAKVRKKLAELK